MKNITRISIAGLLVLSALFVSVGSVFASSTSTADKYFDPVAAANGSSTFSSTTLEIASLPGIVDDGSSMILPVGFTSASGQFEGKGIKIEGLATSKDTVNITFTFPGYRYGWRGSIYQWSGSEWVALPTTIVTPTGENSIYTASVSKVGNGTYAMIMGYEGTSE